MMEITPRPKEKTLLVYHGPHCNDGFTAAWVVAKYMQQEVCDPFYEPPMLYPMGYGEESEARLLSHMQESVSHYTNIVVVDFSLSQYLINAILAISPRLEILILDHHKTAFINYFGEGPRTADDKRSCTQHLGNVTIHLNNGMSGAGICWDWFFPHESMPPLVHYVQDRDLWNFAFSHTRTIHMYIKGLPKTLSHWNVLHRQLLTDTGTDEIVAAGKKLLDIYQSEVDTYAKDSERCSVKGFRGLMAECPPEYSSDVGNVLAASCGTFGLTYSESKDGETLLVSLRSKGTYDVETLAKKFGGGGHRNASGFRVSMDELIGHAAFSIQELGEGT